MNQVAESQVEKGGGISARWAAGIACVEVRHDRSGQKRVYLRITLDEAKKLYADLAAVIAEREPDEPPTET